MGMASGNAADMLGQRRQSCVCLRHMIECCLLHRIVAAFIAIAGYHAHVVPSSSFQPHIISTMCTLQQAAQ